MAAIEDGSIDLAPGTPVPLECLRRLSANPRLRMVTNGYQYMNQIVRLEFNLDHPEFGKLAVRQAIAHSLHRQTLIDEAWLGYGKVSAGPVSPDLKQFCLNNLETPAFGLAQAGQLLDAANLTKGRDGVRLRVVLDYVPAGDGYKRTADFVARALSAVGIEAQVREQGFPAYIKRIYT
ncbi:MAG: ABC transporter substrate-binding protein [Betaproteobacteria bacterium]